MPRARKGYTNRTDLAAQPVRTAPSRTYGEAAASARAQKALPLPQQVGPGGATSTAGQVPPGPLPGANPFLRPTERPNEPITTGLSVGPGPGPSINQPAVDPVAEAIRAIFQAFPNAASAALAEAIR